MNQAQSMLVEIVSSDSFSTVQVHQLCQALPASTDEDMLAFLDQLNRITAVGQTDQAAWETVLASCEAWARQRATRHPGVPLLPPTSESLGRLYAQFGPAQSARYHLLSALTLVGQSIELATFVQLLQRDAPTGLAACTAPFFPLLSPHTNVDALFPELLECLNNPDVGVAVLELSNQLTRNGRTIPHPAEHRTDQLIDLIGGVTRQLETLQQQARDHADEDTAERRLKVANGIALAIALCDALGLIGDQRAARPLKDLMAIQHRRVRVEAAGALARLGHIEGKNILRDLAAEPSVRLRVLAYAEEMDFSKLIDEQYTAPHAVAEAELVTYLSQPTNMGVPPSSCELVDSRTMYWPGFEEPRNCYLFRFKYHAAEPDGRLSTFENLGIAGPLVHAFATTIHALPLSDAYAMFAGWQAEHEEIIEHDLQQEDDSSFDAILNDYRSRLEAEDYEEIQPMIHGKFFGDDILVTACQQSAEPGTAIVDAHAETWYPLTDPQQAYCIYKGTRLLQTFNEDFGAEDYSESS